MARAGFLETHGSETTVTVEAATDDLPEAHRTCIYRVVQEALTNCAKRAKADHVTVSVTGNHQDVVVVVKDDGVGFVSDLRRSGLGLLGIEERVQELEGQVTIKSSRGGGTTLRVQIPVESGAARWARQES